MSLNVIVTNVILRQVTGTRILEIIAYAACFFVHPMWTFRPHKNSPERLQLLCEAVSTNGPTGSDWTSVKCQTSSRVPVSYQHVPSPIWPIPWLGVGGVGYCECLSYTV